MEPVRRQVHVQLDPEASFRLFTADMDSWWPHGGQHTRADDEVSRIKIVFEPFVGGRVFEVLSDGTEGYWGTVTAWAPGDRVTIDWKPNDRDQPHTEVDVTFEAADGGGAIVTLEHRRWELLGDLGREARESYSQGWALIFDERFGTAAGIAT